ncbi:MAG TPA: hypothetical protein VHZ26_14160 [Caulobacteraceae bacterium]|jgi:hypothetical protein|nr:hypothetical protein [Caulobacteraceae bacterium]
MAPSVFQAWRTARGAPASHAAGGAGDERLPRIALAAVLVLMLTACSTVLRAAAWLLHPVHQARRLARAGQVRAAAAMLVFGTAAPLVALVCAALWLFRILHLVPD